MSMGGVCVCLCVCVSEFLTGWRDLQGLIFVTNAILKDMYSGYLLLIRHCSKIGRFLLKIARLPMPPLCVGHRTYICPAVIGFGSQGVRVSTTTTKWIVIITVPHCYDITQGSIDAQVYSPGQNRTPFFVICTG